MSLPPITSAPSVKLPSAANAAVLLTVIFGGLYFASSVFVPLALAVLLSFVLSPLVVSLRRWRVPRAVAVGVVVVGTVIGVGGLGLAMARQVSQLGADLPKYESTLREKLKSLRIGMAQNSLVDKATATLKGLTKELETQSGPASRAATTDVVDPSKPIAVEIHSPPERPLDTYQRILSVILAPLTTTGLVLVLVIFILLQREDIRDRVIRLVGAGDIQRTTAALNDAAFRLSRLFLVQTALNVGFGVVITLGLWIIGVPSPVLWGVTAALMRFIPYIGAIFAAVFPLLLAAAIDPGWSMVIWTAALFLIVEPIVGHLIEPLVQGQNTGLSPLAIVMSAILWTALWGPIGLLLATPLTVSLVVLGRHVEDLTFLDVILGDEPALSPAEVFYQRLLAGSEVEAADQAQEILATTAPLTYFDTVALPGLQRAALDAERGRIDDTRMIALRDGVKVLLDDITDAPKAASAAAPSAPKTDATEADTGAVSTEATPSPEITLKPEWRSETPAIVCIGVRTPLDGAMADILAHLIDGHGMTSRSALMKSASDIGKLDFTDVRLVWVCAVDADRARAQIRYLVRRLRRAAPHVSLIGGMWKSAADASSAEATGVQFHSTDFKDAIRETLAFAQDEAPFERRVQFKPEPV